MRVTASLLTLGLLCGAATADSFADFKAKYGKKYDSAAEESRRRAIFEANMAKAAKQQAAEPYASFGATVLADITEQEFSKYHSLGGLYKKLKKLPLKTVEVRSEVQAGGRAIDWRAKGAVTPVKNQGGDCGSCWSFSTTGGIEGQWALAGHPLTSLSEQELVSCDTIDDNCNGGLMDNALKWLLSNRQGDIATEASYPYVSGSGDVPSCSMVNRTTGATIKDYHNLPENEDDMATWVYRKGPLSIAVDASTWQSYTGGVMSNCPASQLDHGVLIVGFDDAHETPYWIVKNSWTTMWGEDGYIRLAKGSNQCNIKKAGTTSVV